MPITTIETSITEIKNLIGNINYSKIEKNLQFLIQTKGEKKKRNKHQIPLNERCFAKKSGGEQCTRRKKHDFDFCGTHIKGRPHGQTSDVVNSLKKVNVFAEDIEGIIYFIDDNKNVYHAEDVHKQTNNPRIIAKYSKDEYGNYSIVNA
jgi:hypothetical protein